MSSKWKKSPRAKEWVEGQRRSKDWGEIIAGIISIFVFYWVIKGLWNTLKYIICEFFVC